MKIKLKPIVEMLRNLNVDELTEVMMILTGSKLETVIDDPIKSFKELILKRKATSLGDRPYCPYCQSHRVVKNGHKDGRQRFICKNCKHTYTWTNNTILYGMKISYDTLLKYCDCMMNKMTIRQCATCCRISKSSSFDWRHKILDALQNMHNEVVLNGIIESDETYFGLSFKGCKNPNILTRLSHKRGGSNHVRGISDELVCVPCSVNLDGLSIGRITNLGRPTTDELSGFINGRIEEGSFFVTDSLNSYDLIAEDNNLTHIKIESGKHKNGMFNIQKINSYHSELKRMINGRFKGVATKYLNNYVVYHNFVNIAKESMIEKARILKEFVCSTLCNSRGYLIKFRKAIPV